MSLFTQDLRFTNTCLAAYRVLQNLRQSSKGDHFCSMFEMTLQVIFERFVSENTSNLPNKTTNKCSKIIETAGIINNEIAKMNERVIQVLPKELIEMGKLLMNASIEDINEEDNWEEEEEESENEIVEGDVEEENKIGIMVETSFGEVTPKKKIEEKKNNLIENYSSGKEEPTVQSFVVTEREYHSEVVVKKEIVGQTAIAQELERMLEEEDESENSPERMEIQETEKFQENEIFEEKIQSGEINQSEVTGAVQCEFDQKISTYEFQSNRDLNEETSGKILNLINNRDHFSSEEPYIRLYSKQ